MNRGNVSKILACAAFIGICLCSQSAADAVREAVSICMERVIPSLYPLVFATVLLSECGGADVVSRLLSVPCRRLFGLPSCAGFALAAALTGGYPAGAAAVRELYESGRMTGEQAAKTAYVSFSAGPAFIFGVVASAVYSDISVGILLLSVQLFSVVVVAIVVRFLLPHVDTAERQTVRAEGKKNSVFTYSVEKSARSLLSVCVFVTAFSAVKGVLNGSGVSTVLTSFLISVGVPEEYAKSILPVILEVSSGCLSAAGAGLPLVAFALGFGGLSVHFQVYSLLDGIPVNRILFTALRVLQGTLCAGLTAVLSRSFLSRTAAVSVSLGAAKAMPTYTGSVCLVVMCFMVVMCGREHLTTEMDML